VTTNHVLALDPLPLHHRDPFDRLLVAQGITENLQLVRELYVDHMADLACPNRDFFPWVLYLLVGDAVRSGYRGSRARAPRSCWSAASPRATRISRCGRSAPAG